MRGSPGHNSQPLAQLPPSILVMDDLTTELSFNSLDTWVIDVLDLFFYMLSMGVSTTRHWRTSGRLVQELNVCTVVNIFLIVVKSFHNNLVISNVIGNFDPGRISST